MVRGAERFYDRPEVRQALVLLRGAARAAGAGTDATGLPGELAAAVRHVLASAGLTPAPPAARGAVRERWESLAAIAGLADDLAAARPAATLAEFAAELAERAETGHAPVAAAVTLATMHAAKGLEWDAVLLPGPDGGHNAHRARANGRGHRGRAATALRRGHPGAGPPRALLGARADAGRGGVAAAVALPGGAVPAGAGRRRRRCMSDSLDKLLDLLDLEQIEVNIFRGRSPDERVQRVFGGQVAGQALVAAGRTVPEDRPVHSLHAYFIRPGDPTVPLVYTVDRVRDGRSFTTRRVTAIQHGKAIFTLSASFHHPEQGLEHSMPMPAAPAARGVAVRRGAARRGARRAAARAVQG